MRRWIPAAAIAFVYFYAFPYFESLRSANEVPRILLTKEIVDHRTFRLDASARELARGSTFDVATTPDGHRYSNKAPGPSFLAIPAYLVLKVATDNPTLGQLTWAFRITASTLPVLVFLIAFWRRLRDFCGDDAARRAALLAFAFGSMALPYGILFYSHAPAMAFAGGAFCAAAAAIDGSRRASVLVGLFGASAVVCDYQAVLAVAVVGAYLLWQSRRRARDAALAALGAVGPGALLLFYHWAAFGSPFRTGYSFAVDPAHKRGVLGIIGPNWAAFHQAMFSPDNGLIILAPWVILGFAGAWIGRRRPQTLACAAIVVLYVAFISSTVPEFGRGGWSVGPRYIAVAIPFLAWLTAAALEVAESRPTARTAAHALIAVGVIVHVVAATTYPHWPTSFGNPLFEVSFRALREGVAPHSLGTLLGLPSSVSLIPAYAVVVGLAVWSLGLRRTTLFAAIAAAAILLAYSRFPADTPPAKWQFIESQWEPR